MRVPRTPAARTSARTVALGLLAISLAVGGVAVLSVTVADEGATAAAVRQAERLDRGAVSVPTGRGNHVSWRLLGTDPRSVAFHVYRDGARVTASPLTGATSYLDGAGAAGATYTVRAVIGGVEQPASPAARRFGPGGFLDVPLQRPATSAAGATYTANDVSVGDLDGDGDLDLVVKWEPSDSRDNSRPGVTSPVLVDGYRLDGTRLWRIDLGRNIRAGAHYTQFQVYDYDGDGDAEVAMKTADGTVDGRGRVIGSAPADHRNATGYVLEGPEFLTMFDGRTGGALSTVGYEPARGSVSSWGDSYGNRVDRFLAGTAYLDGARPSLVVSRGYYTRTVIVAWDFRDGTLQRRWTFDSAAAGNAGYGGQGNHSLAVADVDGDDRDEIVFGSMAVDDDGDRLWNTGLGVGDAGHLGDLDPTRPGLEYFKISEDRSQPSSWLTDARTGRLLWRADPSGDNGRGVAGDVWAGSPGAEAWSSADVSLRSVSGRSLGRKPSSQNFLVWWDGDPVRELLDRTAIDKYGPAGDTRLLTGAGVAANNGTKATPALSGDILGDWREEVIWRTADSRALRIYSTPVPTTLRIPTLLHDTTYRVSLAWQNTAYNQPPHPGFFLGDGMAAAPWPAVRVPGGAPAPVTSAPAAPRPTATPRPAPRPTTQPATAAAGSNLSRGAGADGSSKAPGTSYSNVMDGDTNTYWSPSGSTGRVSVKWNSAATVGAVVIRAGAGGGTITGWRVVDNGTGAVLASGTSVGSRVAFTPVPLRKINLEITSTGGPPRVAEFETYAR